MDSKRFEMKDKKIGVLMGGMSAERDISLKTGEAALRSLRRSGYNAIKIDVHKGTVPTVLLEKGIEVAFIALHGRYGEDGAIQGLLEIMGIPYTGSGITASTLALNKVMAKRVFNSEGIPTPYYRVLSRGEEDSLYHCDHLSLDFPIVVKPSLEGSTIGISIVHDKEGLRKAIEEAKTYSSTILMERFIDGPEVTVSVLDGEPLPTIEIIPRMGFYDYSSKYTRGMTEYVLPPSINKETDREIQALALKAYMAIGCRGAARVDIIIGSDMAPWVLEINTIPGMTETSLLPKAAESVGISFDSLVEKILLGARLGD